MAGISSKAAGQGLDCGCSNKKGYNGNEIQADEFSDGAGLDFYDFNARTYDQQIGRFIQTDPMTEEGGQESLSQYHFAYNNPILNSDPDGKCPICPAIPFIVEGVKVIGAAIISYIAAKEIAPVAKDAILNTEAPSIPASSNRSVTNNSFAWDPSYLNQLRTSKAEGDNSATNKKSETSSQTRNPHGSKGKPDHQEKVKELAEKAKAENPDKIILQEKKIQVEGSNRRPDVQVVDPKTGKAEKIYEAERRPKSQRNIKRESEYKRLNIPSETHKVGQ
ncbi:MAG TPA: RHS repeat-associated core domain-containing protein [Methanosarcina sp.]|nr:RHS repeat-associated core domain-containing protein [Methanosarcina sp.]